MNPLKSLWEPTKQTEQHWRSAIREESLKWEEGGEEDRVVTVTDPDDGFVSWNLNIRKARRVMIAKRSQCQRAKGSG